MAQKQRERVLSSLGPENLPRARLMRYSRTAREYKLVYRSEDGGGAEFSHATIERQRHAQKLKRKHGRHRAIDASVLTATAGNDCPEDGPDDPED